MKRLRYIGGMLLVIGAIFLIGVTGMGDYNFFDAFARLWPLILINISMDMIFKKKRMIVNFVRVFSVLIFIFYATFSSAITPVIEKNVAISNYSADSVMAQDFSEEESVVEESKLVSSTLNVKDFDIDAIFTGGDSSDFSSAGSYFEDTSAGGDWGFYEIGNINSADGKSPAKIVLTNPVSWDINAEAFDFDATIDASDLTVNGVYVDSFDLNVKLIFDENAKTVVNILSTDAKIKLFIPQSLGVQVVAQVIDINVCNDLEGGNGVYENEAFSENGGVVLNINAVDADIDIEYID